MANVTEVQYFHVEELTQGGDVYKGIEQVDVTNIRGVAVGIRLEGEMTPSAIEMAGTDELGTITARSRSASTLATLLAKTGDVTFKTRNAGQGTSRIVTVSDVEWERSSLTAQRDAKGMFTISGKHLGSTEAAPST